MSSDILRHWHVAALAALLIWGAATVIGSVGQAADADAPAGGSVDTDAIAERLDALIERAAARLGERPEAEGQPVDPDADVATLRGRLEEAETQIRLLKNVVIQALRAQSEAEEALRRERAARSSGAEPEPEPAAGESDYQTLAEQVAALTGSVRRLRADVDDLRARTVQADRQAAASSGGVGEPEDAMLAEGGMGGGYEPLAAEGAGGAAADDATAADAIKIAEVHFNTGSAQLTPGGEQRTREAIERMRSMTPAKVRVVAFTDRVGDAAYNLLLSKERALTVAAVLEGAGFGGDVVEVVGRGEDGLPVPTPDGVPEPLNRSAGIFVVRGHQRRRPGRAA